jgi:uncharacterized membrane protein
MWPACVLLVAAYLPGRIKRTARHPMLLAVKLWALGHLFANGDLGGILLFAAFIAWAGYDRVAVKRRAMDGAAAAPAAEKGPWTNDLIAIVVGTVLYLALGLVFHPAIGLPVFGR